MTLIESLLTIYVLNNLMYTIFAYYRDLKNLDTKNLLDMNLRYRKEAEDRADTMELALNGRKAFHVNGKLCKVVEVNDDTTTN